MGWYFPKNSIILDINSCDLLIGTLLIIFEKIFSVKKRNNSLKLVLKKLIYFFRLSLFYYPKFLKTNDN